MSAAPLRQDAETPPPEKATLLQSLVTWILALLILAVSFIGCLALATLLSDGGASLFAPRWPEGVFTRLGGNGEGALSHPLPAATVAAFALNIAAWIPAAWMKTEKFFDLMGMFTFLAIVVVCVATTATHPNRPPTGWRYLPAAMVTVWTLRLGIFLFMRVHRGAGGDKRFDALKTSPARFLIPWTLQAVWAVVTSAAAMVQIVAPHGDGAAFPGQGAAFHVASAVGIVLWVVGFAMEIVADRQKSQFAAEEKNRGRFIRTGLWSISRHPNYVGEISLWMGMFVLGCRAYVGTQWAAAVSPVFVFLLIRFVSGVPQLETLADRRWGQEEMYQRYKKETPTMIPPPFPSCGK